MGSLIGVLSTVILVSTVCTLIFAVGAYVVSRKHRDGVGSLEESAIPGDDVADQFPPASAPATGSGLFKRVTPATSSAEHKTDTDGNEDYQWK